VDRQVQRRRGGSMTTIKLVKPHFLNIIDPQWEAMTPEQQEVFRAYRTRAFEAWNSTPAHMVLVN
jgi:hypothetical protein